jgi:D-aminopeptidase
MTEPASPGPAPRVGHLPRGVRDAITDVEGVTVGHCTLADGEVQTGVTVVLPHGGDLYLDRVPAAGVVLNGFGKSVGLMQVEELGVLETPIALTNTFSVPAVAAAQIRTAIAANQEIGRGLPTLNPLVFECNDGHLNDIQRMAVEPAHYRDAVGAAGTTVAEGSVGAGRGMSSFGLKAGIGTASRRIRTRALGRFTVGTLVLANFGKPSQIRVCGKPLAPYLRTALEDEAAGAAPPEKGSIIMIVATDAPLDARQLRRVALRTGAGLARTGSVFGHGDIALAFTTAYTVPHDPARPMPKPALLHDAELDPLFEAAADGIEQAIIHAIWRAETVTGRAGHMRRALTDLLPSWADILGA